MKKVIAIFLLIVITLLFGGFKSSNLSNYKISEKEYITYNKKNSEFKVKYVQISGLGNIRLQNQINQVLKTSIAEWINKDCEWMGKSKISIKCKTSKYLSICYTIEEKDPRGKDYESTFVRIGVTIDMHKGVRLFLNNLITDTASLKQKLESYNYANELSPPIESDEANKIIHYTSTSEKKYLEEIYKSDQHVYDFMYTYIRSKPSFYLTNNQVVITRDENDYDDIYINFKQ